MNKNTILIIDDKAVNINMAIQLLSHEHTIKVAKDGKSGLEILYNNHIDLILLDIVMPGLSTPPALR